jgi:predicted transcriptional regulator
VSQCGIESRTVRVRHTGCTEKTEIITGFYSEYVKTRDTLETLSVNGLVEEDSGGHSLKNGRSAIMKNKV